MNQCFTILLGAFLGVLALSGRAAAPDPEASGLAASQPFDLEKTGNRLLEILGTDPEAQAKQGERLVAAWMEAGDAERARKTMDGFGTWRNVQASYKLATWLAGKGRMEEARAIHDAALKKSQGVLDFEKDEIAGARALSRVALGEADQGVKEAEAISGPLVRGEALAGIAGKLPPVDAAALARKLKGDDLISYGTKGEALLQAARANLPHDPAQATTLAGEAALELVKKADTETIPRLCAVAHLLVEAGNVEEARRWADVAKGFADRVDRRADWLTRDLLECIRAYESIGDKTKADALRVEMPDRVIGRGDSLGFARSAMTAAEIFAATGDWDKFHRAAVHVLQSSLAYVHHRARARAGVEVVAAYIRHAKFPDVRVVAELDALFESIRKDPHYRPNR